MYGPENCKLHLNFSADLKCLYFLHLCEFGLLIEIQHSDCAKGENINTPHKRSINAKGVEEGGLKSQTFKEKYKGELEFLMCIEMGGVQTKTFPIMKV